MKQIVRQALMLGAMVAMAPGAAVLADQPAKPAAEQAAFHDEVVKVYWIDPSKAKDKEYLAAGSKRMDDFWKKALSNKKRYAPLIAAELQRDDLPPNFYLDGSQLLQLLDSSQEMGRIAAAGLLKVDFAKIRLNPGNYVIAANMLMANGIDTTDVGLHVLDADRDEFMINLPIHVFYYNKLEALTWTLFGMEESRFVPKLIARLQTETDNHNLAAIIQALWESVTPEGWAALKAYAEGPCKNRDACDFAREMLAHKGDAPPAKGLKADDLRAQRRAIAKAPFGHGSFTRFHRLSDDLAAIDAPRL